MQISITPANDDPVLTLPTGTTGYTEGSTVFVTPTATLTDVDSADFDGGQLVVTIASGGEALDRLYVNSEGTGPGQVFASGSSVSYNDGGGSVVIGTLSGGYGAGDPLVITFNATATADGVAAVAEQVLFWNTSDDPSVSSRTVTMQVTDGDGGTSTLQTRTIDVTAANDAPTAANDTASVDEGQSVLIDLAGNDSDPDNPLDLSSIVITSGPTNGSLVDHGDGTFTYTHDGSETIGDSFSYTIDDASGATSNVASVTLMVTPVNDAPTAVNDTASVEEGSSVLIDLTGNDSDPDNPLDLSSIVITSGPTNGSLVDHGDGTFTYTHDGSETVGDSFSYTIDDAAGATSNIASVTLTVTPVNDAPTATISPHAFGVSEDDGYRGLFGISVGDVDADSAAELAVTLNVDNGLINLADTTGLTFTSGTNNSGSMTFTGTLSDLNAALATLSYRPDVDFFRDRCADPVRRRPGQYGWSRPDGQRHGQYRRQSRQRRARAHRRNCRRPDGSRRLRSDLTRARWTGLRHRRWHGRK